MNKTAWSKHLAASVFGCLLGVFVLTLSERTPWRLGVSANHHGALPEAKPTSRARNSTAFRLAEQYERSMQAAGAYTSEGRRHTPLVRLDRSFDENAWNQLDLEPELTKEVQTLVEESFRDTSADLALRLIADPRKNIDYGDDWDTFYIPGNPDESQERLKRLQSVLEARVGEATSEVIMKGLHAPSHLAYFGRSDVFIQRRAGATNGDFSGSAEFFDPVTGTRLSSVVIDDTRRLNSLLGPDVAARLALP